MKNKCGYKLHMGLNEYIHILQKIQKHSTNWTGKGMKETKGWNIK